MVLEQGAITGSRQIAARRLRVLLVSHAFGPNLGSEPGNAWKWASHLAAHYDVWIICHTEFRAEFDRLPTADIPERLRIVWTPLVRPFEPWVPGQGEIRFKLHYFMWLRAALEKARELHAEVKFDIVHQIGLTTVSSPSPFWKLGIPLVWGPLGGGQIAPVAFRSYFGSWWWAECLRSLRVKTIAWWPSLRRTIRHSSLTLATNSETMALLRKAGARNLRFLLDSGATAQWRVANVPRREVKDSVTLVWCGRLEPRKALGLALEALREADDRRLQLVVIGSGPLRQQWQSLTDQLRLGDQVYFAGSISNSAVREQLLAADGLVFTSLRDSFGSIVLEAMALGLPILTLAHQGAGAFVPPEAGIKVPVTTPGETVSALARAFREFAQKPELRQRMSVASWNHSGTQLWESRARQVADWYREIIEAKQR